jgi:predicted XRE-type DNA-binding protein
MVAEETVKLDKITHSPAIVKALRGEVLDGDAIERYVEKYENGEELPPLDVQKDTYLLIDGYHRLLALEKLGRQEARVKVWDVDDKGLLFFAYDRNDTHGIPITKKCRDRMIWTARHEYHLTEEVIAKRFHISRSRVSQILDENVSNVNTNTKVDKRRTVDDDFEVLKVLPTMSQAEIAKMFGVDPSRISQIKKEYHIEDMQTYAMIKAPQNSLADLFKTASLNGLLSFTSMNFTKDKIEL